MINNLIIRTEHLSVSYGNLTALSDVSLSFEERKITAIIGKSGCGKTTLLKTLNNSIAFDSNATTDGKIFFLDKELSEYSSENLKKKIGMVMQTPVVFPLSIKANLDLVLKYHYKLSKSEISDRIENVLQKVQLFDEVKDCLTKSAENLSGGQKQRLCLARTLLTQPDVLLLDEPCSALDLINQSLIENLLLSLKKEMTIIIVTHNISEAKILQDNTIFMQDGEIIETSCSLFDNPLTEEAKSFLRKEE